MKFNIYHGLGGGFGGANYDFTGEFENEDEAAHCAYELACEDYQMYEGLHGIMSEHDVAEEYSEDCGKSIPNFSAEDWQNVEDQYLEELESWLDYYAVPAEEDDLDEEEICER